MSDTIDAIVQVDVRALLRDHPDGWQPNEPGLLDKYYDVFVPRRYTDPKVPDRIICNVYDRIVFRVFPRSGTGRYIMFHQFAAKTPKLPDFNKYLSLPQFNTGRGEGREYASASLSALTYNGWEFLNRETEQAPERTEHFMEIQALEDTLKVTGQGFDQDMRFMVGFTLQNDGGVWVKYRYDPRLKIRLQDTPYNDGKS